jgi:very-short-patch-repair endonuclease
MSKLEELFSFHLKTAGLAPVAEYRFAAEIVGTEAGVRKRLIEAKLKDWRFDFAFVDLKVAIEIEGTTSFGKNKNGTMRLGRHQTAKGFAEDCLKYNSAYLHGWTVLRFDGRMVRTLEAIDTTKAFLARVKAND